MWLQFRPHLMLALVCLALYVPGIATLPPLDRDESRFAQASRQMLETGDPVRIQFQDVPRHKKPAGAYWLQAASAALLGGPAEAPIWAYRLPSALAATGAALALFALGGAVVGRRAAFTGALLVATALVVVAEAHQAKTDALLLFTVVLAMGALGRAWMAGRPPPGDGPPVTAPGWGTAALFWGAIGAGILVKGPITPLVAVLAALTLGVWERRWRWIGGLRPLPGLALAAAIAGPWFWAVSQATDGGFVGEAVRTDLLPKLLGAQESHGAPPGYYALLSPALFWPGSLLLGAALAFGWARRRDPAARFLIAWALPCWLMFEAVPTKLPHYVLPAFPALALLGAWALEEAGRGRWAGLSGGWAKAGYGVWALPGLALAGAAVALPVVYGGGLAPATLPAATILLATTAGGLWFAFRGRAVDAARVALVGGGIGMILILEVVAPRLDALWVSPRAAEAVARHRADATVPVAAAGYHEPSLVFLLGTNTRLTDGSGAAGHLVGAPGRLALVADTERPAFEAAAAAAGLPPRALARIPGFNYSRGKPVVLTLYGGPGS